MIRTAAGKLSDRRASAGLQPGFHRGAITCHANEERPVSSTDTGRPQVGVTGSRPAAYSSRQNATDSHKHLSSQQLQISRAAAYAACMHDGVVGREDHLDVVLESGPETHRLQVLSDLGRPRWPSPGFHTRTNAGSNVLCACTRTCTSMNESFGRRIVRRGSARPSRCLCASWSACRAWSS